MRNTTQEIAAPETAGLVPVLLLLPFLSIVAFAVVLNWGRL